MDLDDLKHKIIKEELGITQSFGTIFSFIDFGNVNNWFGNDIYNYDNQFLEKGEKIVIDIKKLHEFTQIFSTKIRLYYGQDIDNAGSIKFIDTLRIFFGKRNIVTKNIQKIKHSIDSKNTSKDVHTKIDALNELFLEIRKCNFDVEIAVDASRMLDYFDTFCLFSGDADFVYLNNFLKKKGKKIILIKGGHITLKLRESADLIINAQDIKKYIVRIKQRPD